MDAKTSKLLAACEAALDHLKATLPATEAAALRQQLADAIATARTPKRFAYLNEPARESAGDPFAGFRSGEFFGLRRKN
jgi:hypothetical protein